MAPCVIYAHNHECKLVFNIEKTEFMAILQTFQPSLQYSCTNINKMQFKGFITKTLTRVAEPRIQQQQQHEDAELPPRANEMQDAIGSSSPNSVEESCVKVCNGGIPNAPNSQHDYKT